MLDLIPHVTETLPQPTCEIWLVECWWAALRAHELPAQVEDGTCWLSTLSPKKVPASATKVSKCLAFLSPLLYFSDQVFGRPLVHCCCFDLGSLRIITELPRLSSTQRRWNKPQGCCFLEILVSISYWKLRKLKVKNQTHTGRIVEHVQDTPNLRLKTDMWFSSIFGKTTWKEWPNKSTKCQAQSLISLICTDLRLSGWLGFGSGTAGKAGTSASPDSWPRHRSGSEWLNNEPLVRWLEKPCTQCNVWLQLIAWSSYCRIVKSYKML